VSPNSKDYDASISHPYWEDDEASQSHPNGWGLFGRLRGPKKTINQMIVYSPGLRSS
jgi:hypothetical protein